MGFRPLVFFAGLAGLLVLFAGTLLNLSNYQLDSLPVSWPGDIGKSPLSQEFTGDDFTDDFEDEDSTIVPVGEPDFLSTSLQTPGIPSSTQKFPVSGVIPLPTEKATHVVQIQHSFAPENSEAAKFRESRRSTVREAIQHSFNGYMLNAWMKDEVAPVTGGYRTTLAGWGATLIDSLDTLWIAGLKDDFEFAVAALDQINFDEPDNVPLNVFEITIRYLGGLLGAYDVSEERYPILLKKAKELGEMLYGAFDTPSRMPVLSWRKLGIEPAPGEASLAELGSMTLEFTRLSILTGDPKFYDAVQRITDGFHRNQNNTKLPGMWPSKVNARQMDFSQGMEFSLAGSSDSMYEYLAKTYLLLDGRVHQYKTLYVGAVKKIKEHLLFKPLTPEDAEILFAGTLKVWTPERMELEPVMTHLACFAGGMLALGSKIFNRTTDLTVGRQLVDGCIWAYRSMQTGIMPESFITVPCGHPDEGLCTWDENAWANDMFARNSFDEKPTDSQLPRPERIAEKSGRLRLPRGVSAIGNRRYMLRPEAIESIFVLYRITGDQRLVEEAWQMFNAVVNETRTDIAFSSVDDVTVVGSNRLDRMESYWTSETLKYFYLMFCEPDVVSLDRFVFNTEGHPLLIGFRNRGLEKAGNALTAASGHNQDGNRTFTAAVQPTRSVDDHGFGVHHSHGVKHTGRPYIP